MQVVTSDGEFIGTVENPTPDGFTLRRLNASDGPEETVPSLWVDAVDQQVRLNRSGAETVAGWKSLKFKTSSGDLPANPAANAATPAATSSKLWLWILLGVVAIAILLFLLMAGGD
jgi:hypothetical protein